MVAKLGHVTRRNGVINQSYTPPPTYRIISIAWGPHRDINVHVTMITMIHRDINVHVTMITMIHHDINVHVTMITMMVMRK